MVAGLLAACTASAAPRGSSAAPGWIAFPGGYDVPAPACVHLDIRVAGVTRTVAVGIGTACGDQRPPAVPDDASTDYSASSGTE
jgi:hypothetical protein